MFAHYNVIESAELPVLCEHNIKAAHLLNTIIRNRRLELDNQVLPCFMARNTVR